MPRGGVQSNSALASINQGSINYRRSGDHGIDLYHEPELADMEVIKSYHQRQAKVSQDLLAGEMTFASSPPLDSPNPSSGVYAEELSLKERIRKLEDLVYRLQEQVKHLNTQINVQKK